MVLSEPRLFVIGSDDELKAKADNGWLRPHKTSPKEVAG
jgi:hypothetical protein